MNAPLPNFAFHDLKPALADFRREVLAGLAAQPRRIAPKFFYDAAGSRLFDRITQLAAYYPTRTEIGLLKAHGAAMAERLGRGSALIELGSGSDLKIRTVLDALAPAEYLPLDISGSHLRTAAMGIARDYPGIQVRATCVDYTRPFTLPATAPGLHRVAFYPGSSIGNFEPGQVLELLGWIATLVGPGGRLLVGVDLKKDEARLNAAYNDPEGVTADFNRNLLVRMAGELDARVALDAFAHHAYYNRVHGRIEMHLRAQRPTTISLDGQRFDFAAGEGIHTESSYKYTVDEFTHLAALAGFVSEQVWCDDQALFSVHCLRARVRA
jgi:dimethylhistidine N-methyltransferase